jgi:hypothetical protein
MGVSAEARNPDIRSGLETLNYSDLKLFTGLAIAARMA